MGSPGRNLNVPEHLRGWYEAGVHHFFLPGRSCEAGQAAPDAASIRAGSAPTQTAARSMPPCSVPARSNNQQPSSSPSSPGQAATPQNDAQETAQRASKVADDSHTTWPELWQKLWLRTPHDPKIVWTYYDLGAHMAGQPDKAIAQLLQSIIYYFRWPKGTIAFWPMTELVDEQLQPNRDMFWRGVDLLGCGHVALFGRDAVSHLVSDGTFATDVVKVGGTQVHLLPTLAELEPMLPHERLIALDSLKQLPF
ncbi:hypothetical protein SAMN02745704_02282 [Paucidesulfovibrio gracilis DSM 16080]|uniref:Uncharacterized protein n=1 Tax=Paucidesulfovibrio gracilis DSM 16080 TaxID=1121449 RepID=A0A1T4XNB2_9BACT|nr:hypothetical protein [Paucidesulfovibrio gracilis]SKA91022.1 hypothetical protein SAMN02745704_02282 [Paucidesulfovibrio gracilis DSM 16080]